MAARVLADHARAVVIIERDDVQTGDHRGPGYRKPNKATSCCRVGSPRSNAGCPVSPRRRRSAARCSSISNSRRCTSAVNSDCPTVTCRFSQAPAPSSNRRSGPWSRHCPTSRSCRPGRRAGLRRRRSPCRALHQGWQRAGHRGRLCGGRDGEIEQDIGVGRGRRFPTSAVAPGPHRHQLRDSIVHAHRRLG